MTTVRNKFHELGNWHNKISLAAIVTREAIDENNLTQLSEFQLRKIATKAIGTLNKIEQYVVNADKTIDDIKPFIYKMIGPDANIPKQEESL